MTIIQKKMVNLGNLLAMSNSGIDIVEGLDIINKEDIHKSMFWINIKLEGYNTLSNNNPNMKFSKYINMLKDAYNLYENIEKSKEIGGV